MRNKCKNKKESPNNSYDKKYHQSLMHKTKRVDQDLEGKIIFVDEDSRFDQFTLLTEDKFHQHKENGHHHHFKTTDLNEDPVQIRDEFQFEPKWNELCVKDEKSSLNAKSKPLNDTHQYCKKHDDPHEDRQPQERRSLSGSFSQFVMKSKSTATHDSPTRWSESGISNRRTMMQKQHSILRIRSKANRSKEPTSQVSIGSTNNYLSPSKRRGHVLVNFFPRLGIIKKDINMTQTMDDTMIRPEQNKSKASKRNSSLPQCAEPPPVSEPQRKRNFQRAYTLESYSNDLDSEFDNLFFVEKMQNALVNCCTSMPIP